MYKTIYDNLSDFEKKVFELRVDGFSYKEISQKLCIELKKVDNAVQRIRVKASSALSHKVY